MNSQIRIPEVRLIDEEEKVLGVVPTAQAMQMAQERGLDLVEVQPTAKPSVCRLMDYKKFLYRLVIMLLRSKISPRWVILEMFMEIQVAIFTLKLMAQKILLLGSVAL